MKPFQTTPPPVVLGVFLAAFSVVAGCGVESPPPGASLTMMLDTAPVIEIEEAHRYGLDGTFEGFLVRPFFVGTDEKGYVYILDALGRGMSELKRYSPSGEFDRTVVRGGEGPFSWLRMEYPGSLLGLWVDSSTSIVVWNPVTADLLTFDVDGEMTARTSWAHISEDFDLFVPLRPYQGDVLAYFRNTEPTRGRRPTLHTGYLRVRKSGAVVDTAWAARRPADRIEVDQGGRRRTVPLPLSRGLATPFEATELRLATPFGDGRILVARFPEPMNEYVGDLRLDVLGADGLVNSRTLIYTPVELPVGELRERALERYRDRHPRSILRMIEQNLNIQRFVPPLLGINAYPDESIWLRLALTSESLEPPDLPSEFLVMGTGHEPTFRVSLPPHTARTVDQSGKLWMTLSTESGEPYVGSYLLKR